MKKIFTIFFALAIFASPIVSAVSHAQIAGASVRTTTVFDTGVVISGSVFDPSIKSVYVTYATGATAVPGGQKTAAMDGKGNFTVEIDELAPKTKYFYQIINAADK